MKKRALSLLLALVMVVSAMVTASIMVVAADHEIDADVEPTTPSMPGSPSVYTGTPDFSWFKVENTGTDVSPAYAVVAPEDNTYVLESADAFVGFRDLTNGKGKGFCDLDDDGVVDEGELVAMAAQTFAGEITVKLDVNVVINTGDADTWGRYNRTGLYEWTPIAHDMNGTKMFFAGTFDGDGHYISGVYANANWTGSQTNVSNGNGTYNGRDNGLFGYVKGGTVKNFVLTNSTFVAWNTDRNSNGNGLITKMNNGATLENVYSDAYVSGQWNVGGLVGNLGSSGTNSVKGCIFAGKLEITKSGDGWGPFVGHADSKATGGIVDCLYMGSAFPSARQALSTARIARIADMPFAVSANIPYANSIRVIDGVEKTTTSFTFNANWKAVTIEGESRRVPAVAWDNYSKWFAVETSAPAAVTNAYNGTPDYSWYVASTSVALNQEETVSTEDGTKTYTYNPTVSFTKVVTTKGAYVIDSAEDLYGFSYLSNGLVKVPYSIKAEEDTDGDGTYTEVTKSGTLNIPVQTFAGETVVLGANITVNGGDASTWSYQNQPTYEWIPVAHQQGKWASDTPRSFRGTFDGQGYTISGLFSDTFWNDTRLTYQSPISGGNNGANGSFICHAYNATIKNFSLINSAFVSYGAHLGNSQGFGTIEKADGTTKVSNIYSEVILQGGYAVGGIVGFMRDGASVDNCVWAGAITGMNGAGGLLIGGIVGACDGTSTKRTVSNCLSTGTIHYSINQGNSSTINITGICGNGAYGVVISNVVSANIVNNVDGQVTNATYGAITNSTSRTAEDPKKDNVPTGPVVYSWAVLENAVYDSSLLPSTVKAIRAAKDSYTTKGALTAGGDTPADRSDDVYESLTFSATPVADLASFDVSAWTGWTKLSADIPVPTAAWALAEKTFDDVKLAFVQETDVAEGEYTVRLAAEVFNLDASKAGFEILVGDEFVKLGEGSTTVYKSLNAKGEDGEISQIKADYGRYYTALEVNVAAGSAVSFTVRPYIVIEGETVYGDAYTISYDANGVFQGAVAAK